ncbi:unnamed protein product [Clonostachys byssicola]|uniref:Uncharacterized protein n=1 Tax=Clonostachys byssicola TaxID=160290 RepID=A0A9N9YAC0_9HYPO|nr:unnamed protein product [Clonostachys byssicola]
MRFNLFLAATGLASAAITTSYSYARGLDADYPELEERDVFSSKEEASHFLRSLDEDELNALYPQAEAERLEEDVVQQIEGDVARRERISSTRNRNHARRRVRGYEEKCPGIP